MLPHSYAFRALGTHWDITTKHALTDELRAGIDATIEAFDMTYSRFRSDSLITQITKQEGDYTFPDTAISLFGFYKTLYDVTGGKITPLIGSMLERAGYDANYSFVAGPQDALPSWSNAMSWKGSVLHTTQPITLDVGAAGKGYLVDIISDLLDRALVSDYVIDASGDLRHKGTTENRVGLEHPLETDKVIGVIDVQNQSLAASAVNRRTWGDGLHHIFDPDSQAPTKAIIATWVVTKEAMFADGLATALFFVDPDKLRGICEFQYVRMHTDGHLDYSRDFKGELF